MSGLWPGIRENEPRKVWITDFADHMFIITLYHILNVFYKSVALVAAAFESSVRSALQLSLPRRIAESIIFEQMASLSELSYALFFGHSKIFLIFSHIAQ